MEKKSFKSRLFRRMVDQSESDYWKLLYAEILFRLKELEDLNCSCTFCFRDKVHCKNIIDQMVRDCHINENPKPKNFLGRGDCGRSLGPAA